MQPINLAKTKILERRYCRRCFKQQVFSALVVVTLVAGISVWAAEYRERINSNTSTVTAEVKHIQADCQGLRNQIGRDKTIVSRSDWQDQLALGTEQRAEVIKAVLCSVPSDTWIDSVGDFDKSTEVSISGISPSFGSLCEFTCGLRRFSIIRDVQLGSTSIVTHEAGQRINFAVQLQTNSKSADADSNRSKKTAQVPGVGVTP